MVLLQTSAAESSCRRGEYLTVLRDFIQASRARGSAAFVAAPEWLAELVRRELGDDSAQVALVDMAQLGRNPARIIPGSACLCPGRRAPTTEELGGKGRWLVNRVCDLVQARSGQAGTVTRLHMACAG